VSTAARRGQLLALSIALVGLVAIPYWQVRGHAFLTHDDPGYLRRNLAIQDGLSWEGVRFAFTSFRMANWHPLTWLSHMLDIELFRMRPGPHHLMSAGLHALNGVLLLLALARMTRAPWTSALVAALFLVHPLRVESVAWASERKDVLAGTCFMLALLAYARFAERQTPWRAAFVWLAMAAGLMAKPMLVTLPAVLLLLDTWPLGRLFARGPAVVLREKLPLLPLVAGSAVVTVLAQRSLGAIPSFEQLPLLDRLLNVPLAYVSYLRKAFWPTDLSFFYPHATGGADGGPPLGSALAATALLLLVTGAVLALLPRGDGRNAVWAVGWLWFLGMLVPVIGIVQVGSQALADRYAYLPLIGLSLPLAFGLRALGERGRAARALAIAVGLGAVLACLPLTHAQVATWADSETLYRHALALDADNYLAHANLGTSLVNREQYDEAAGHFERAIAIAPTFDKARAAYASLLLLRGRPLEAVQQLEAALAVDGERPECMHLLGRARLALGEVDAAVVLLGRAADLDPTRAEVFNDLGQALMERGDADAALRAYRRALALDPDMVEAQHNLRLAREAAGR